MGRLEQLMNAMVEYDAGDPKRIQHFVKVHAFARQIGLGEGAEPDLLLTLEAASIVHDIGIHLAELKHNSTAGKYQELEGPAPAREMLSGLGFDAATVDRVCYLVGHHHTYGNMDGLDYQALVEADFLVNLYEDGTSRAGIEAAYKSIFKTETGRRLCRTMFGL